DSAGRDKPGPTEKKCVQSATARFCRASPCGAGFMPADGGGNHTRVVAPTPLAGINPAPQEKCVQSATARSCRASSLWAGFMPADGGGKQTQAVAPTPLAGINPAPHRPCENSSAPYREPCLAFPIRRRQVEAFLLDGEKALTGPAAPPFAGHRAP